MLGFITGNIRWLGTGLLLALASSFGQTWFISLFAGEIRAAHGLTNGEWGTIYTVATLASAALILSRGALADTMPLSRLVAGVTLLFAFGVSLMAVAEGIALLLIAVFLLRFCGQGMFSHISVTAMGRWFHATRGRAVAFAGLGHPIGEALFPLPTVLLIALAGWRQTWLMVAAILVAVILPTLLLLLRHDRDPGGTIGAMRTSGLGDRHWTRREALGHWLFPALLPFMLTPGFIGTVMFFHQAHVAEVKGWSLAQMAPGYIVYAAISVVASLSAGWAADRFGAERLLPVTLVPMGIAMLLIGPAASPAAWIVALAIMGITQGALQSLMGAFWPRVYGTRHLGAVRSLQTVIMVISTAIGPGLTGLLIDLGISFPRQGLGLGLWCLVLSLALWPVARKIRREFEAATP